MNIQDTQALLNIIDSRVKKYINESKLLRQYVGIVVGLTDTNAKYQVKLAGSDTVFTFLNKSGEILEVDDCVYIQTTGTDLNTGIITQKTKEDNNVIDYIVEQNIVSGYNSWSYRKWNSGVVEAWGKFIIKLWDMTFKGNDNYEFTLDLPFAVNSPHFTLTTGSEKHTTAAISLSGDNTRQVISICTHNNYPEYTDTDSVTLYCHFYDTEL